MTKYARLNTSGIVIEVCDSAAWATHEPVLRSKFIECPDEVTPGAHQNENGNWTLYVAPSPVPQPYPLLEPMVLYMAFTPGEWISIKASTDSRVVEFLARCNLAISLRAATNPNLDSFQSDLAYLAAPVSPGYGVGILSSAARIADISNGVPQ